MDEKSVQLSYEGQQPIHRLSAKQDECKIWRRKEQKNEKARPKIEEALNHTLASSVYSGLNYLAHM